MVKAMLSDSQKHRCNKSKVHKDTLTKETSEKIANRKLER
jgi:hypothetical protein